MKRASFTFSSFFVFLVITMIVMYIGSKMTITVDSSWYRSLKQPSFTPPDIVFSIAWGCLYVCMAISATFLWKSRKTKNRSLALLFWWIQLLLNLVWLTLFFGYHLIFISFVALCILWLCTLSCLIYSFKTKPIAGYFFIPYILWLSFACLLNLFIYLNN